MASADIQAAAKRSIAIHRLNDTLTTLFLAVQRLQARLDDYGSKHKVKQ
jgi:hypothetical protein